MALEQQDKFLFYRKFAIETAALRFCNAAVKLCARRCRGNMPLHGASAARE